MGNPFESIQATPEVEPGICATCKAIYEVPRGVISQCSAHDPPGQIATVPLLFKLLSQATADPKTAKSSQVVLLTALMTTLQAAILAEKPEPAPPTP